MPSSLSVILCAADLRGLARRGVWPPLVVTTNAPANSTGEIPVHGACGNIIGDSLAFSALSAMPADQTKARQPIALPSITVPAIAVPAVAVPGITVPNIAGELRDVIAHQITTAKTSPDRIVKVFTDSTAESVDVIEKSTSIVADVEEYDASHWRTLFKDDMECKLCVAVLFQPVTTPCGHSFCMPCLIRALDYRLLIVRCLNLNLICCS